MAEIISERTHTPFITYRRHFATDPEENSGYAFTCDANGVVSEPEYDSGRENLRKCLAGEEGLLDLGVRKYEVDVVDPAVLRCDCGRRVELSGFTNACACGRDYNMDGQKLAPRSQWGEETGESLSDILSIR